MDYDLSRLGNREFEHLSQALAIRVLGPGVTVFGSGPDGGREATFDGPVDYPSPSTTGTWNGFGVVQAKFKERLTDTTEDNKWIVRQIKKELEKWKAPSSNRSKNRVPSYVMFTTNVWISSVPESGGIDAANALIESFADALGLQDWAIWGGDQICRYLDNFAEIRQAFGGFTTPGDVLERLHHLLPEEIVEVSVAAGRHACSELFASQWIRLNQAGSPENEKLKLSEIGADLPGVAAGRDVLVVRDAISRGDSIMRPTARRGDTSHLVWVGGPGQGKSTLTQLLAQAYRAALLADRPAHRLGPSASVLAAVRDRLRELGLPEPRSRRWPIAVNLNDYGEAVSRDRELSLLGFIAQQVSKRLDHYVGPHHMRSWLGSWPWLLILDGLDEVAAPSAREAVEQRINEFLITAADVDADLFAVGTTRPQGYNDEFPVDQFEHVTLRPLEVAEAIDYGLHLSEVRHRDDPDLAEQVASRLGQAAQEHFTARLMRTPLQVTIMTLLLERQARVPDSRYSLFESYYHTIYTREVSKGGPTASLLEQHRNDINAVHQQVALLLHSRAEQHPDRDSLVSLAELDALTRIRLHGEGIGDEESQRLAAQLVAAATRRLVLLAPIAQDHVGFDVRSLQEFMAAQAIATGPDDEVLRRMKALAPSAHWRNTWLLAGGRIFRHSEHLRLGLVAILDEIDTESPLAMIIAPGSRLALDMLDDDTSARARGIQRTVVKRALALINQPPNQYTEKLATTLHPMLARDPELGEMIMPTLRRAVHGGDWSLLAGAIILAEFADKVSPVQTVARNYLRDLFRAVEDDKKDALVHVARQFPHPSLRRFEKAPSATYRLDSHAALGRLLKTPLEDPRCEIARQDVAARMRQYDPSSQDGGVDVRSLWSAFELTRIDHLLPDLVPTAANESGEAERFGLNLALLSNELTLVEFNAADQLRASLVQFYGQQQVTKKLGDLIVPLTGG
ncbi:MULTISPECIES: NACHT domain-containing NTPase [unclassified Crossiella]|uniref:NACHT domain-containing protein n=1 Tax=unclassified Crossiella TaxID=2620835 RepID=UPI0020003ECD|nr:MULTISPECIES: hypothetical protein [unclassified Crossiella]MCK2240988.1 hypothetical protein [Crossiella sp. S99.2]MCK2253868.1 hypothetical protein [Crossiella sp. S99.1]